MCSFTHKCIIIYNVWPFTLEDIYFHIRHSSRDVEKLRTHRSRRHTYYRDSHYSSRDDQSRRRTRAKHYHRHYDDHDDDDRLPIKVDKEKLRRIAISVLVDTLFQIVLLFFGARNATMNVCCECIMPFKALQVVRTYICLFCSFFKHLIPGD